MSPVELAWAAGFFEGEGHVAGRKNLSGFTVGVTQADRASLERFRRAMHGIGFITVTNPRPTAPHHKRILRWEVHRWTEVQAALAMLVPNLTPGPKRDAAMAALRYLSTRDSLRGAGACARGHLHREHGRMTRAGKYQCNRCARDRRRLTRRA